MKWSYWIRNEAERQMPMYVFVSVLFVMGVAFGALLVNALTLEQQQDVSSFVGSFLQTMAGPERADVPLGAVFLAHVKWVLLLWVFGLSVIGLPVIFALNFLKGFLIGFSTGFLMQEMSWDGVLLAAAAIAPQNLVVIPVIIVTSVSAVAFSLVIVRTRLIRQTNDSLLPHFTSYGLVTLCMIVLLFAVSVYETEVTPKLLAWLASTRLESF